MAVFVAASDESSGKHRRDKFVLSGLVARERDWSEIFAPAWQKLVLDGPPKIPYLHMTDMRSRGWRLGMGLSEEDSSQRIDNAVSAIVASDFLYPIGLMVNAGGVDDAFSGLKVKATNRRGTRFEPDFLCFLGYAMLAADYVSRFHKDCEKLDFVVERNGKITDYIGYFHDNMEANFVALERPDLARLVGELLPVGKDRIPVQAADVLCWHTARPKGSMDSNDRRRYQSLSAKNGSLQTLSNATVTNLSELLKNGNSTLSRPL